VTEREACIILNMISGVGSARLEAMLTAFGSPANILAQSKESLATVKNIPEKLAASIADWHHEVDHEKEMQFAERAGVRIITRFEPEYPELLKEIYDPPICLYVRGTLPDFSTNTVAVVGSRRMTIYGKKMARLLAESAAYAGWKVVSGLAYGVDAVAHQATLDAQGVTVAVLGGGLARIHPQEHVPLARAICEQGGALISEYPMHFPVSRQSFPRRNRIISGLSQGVIVVEAGLNSGALLTANIALEQGRSVFAVPGEADNPQAKGCHALIKTGAKLTESFDDVLEDFEFLPGFNAVRESQSDYLPLDDEMTDGMLPLEMPDAAAVAPTAPPEDHQVVNALAQGGEKTVDELAVATGIAPGKLLATLMRLEIRKAVKQLPGKVFTLFRS